MRLSEKNQTFFVFAFKFLYEVVDEAVVKIFSTKMGNTSASLDFDNIVFNGKDSEGDIAGSSTEVKDKDEDIAFTDTFIVETVRDSSSCGFVDDTKGVNSRDSRSVFCGLSLRVIEVCRDSDDSIDGTSKVRFGSGLHLKEYHRKYFFQRGEKVITFQSLNAHERDKYRFFLFITVFITDIGLAVLVKDLEWERLEIALEIRLDLCIIKFASDETFYIKYTEDYSSLQKRS